MAKKSERLTRREKEKNKKAWYKERINEFDNQGDINGYGFGNVSEYKRMKVNYDLYNNILDLSDFEYVCKPFGSEVGELPAEMVNRDIVSGKIKVVLGMEMKRPFKWSVIATNPEASTRKERVQYKMIRDYVVNNMMLEIRKEVEVEKMQEFKGRKLDDDEREKIEQEITQEMKVKTPEEIGRYMEREYKDVAEVMSHQLLEYLIEYCSLPRKFNTAFKHGMLSGMEAMYVGIFNGEPQAWNVNSLRLNVDESPDIQFIEDGEWATCEYRMPPSEVVKHFGEELTDDQIDSIYESWNSLESYDNLFDIDETIDNDYISVLHVTWKSLRKIGFLTFTDEAGNRRKVVVDESYKFDEEGGDIDLEWEWIPEVYEGWKIRVAEPIYVGMKPMPGQFKDINNLYYCKLPYKGAIYDNMNSEKTSLMDRLKIYQYYYNIVMYRIELLLASDKGKKVLMNINMIPDSAGIDIEKWQYFMESTPYMWYDPNEEGNGATDAGSIAKEIDLSLASDINKYIEIAEYLRVQAGRSVGITDQVEGMIGPDEAVRNTQQVIIQSSHILEPYFQLHDEVKKNTLQALLEMAKVAYSGKGVVKLNYVVDDVSRRTLELDTELLDNSTLGLFIGNSSETVDVRRTIQLLSHAAIQNQMMEMSDIIDTVKQTSVTEAEEVLKAAEEKRHRMQSSLEERRIQAAKEEAVRERKKNEREHEQEKEIIRLKAEQDRKTEIIKSALIGASFNPDTDVDDDGINDYIEIAKHGLDADIKREKQKLDREKFEHEKKMDKKELEIKKKQIQQENSGKSEK